MASTLFYYGHIYNYHKNLPVINNRVRTRICESWNDCQYSTDSNGANNIAIAYRGRPQRSERDDIDK